MNPVTRIDEVSVNIELVLATAQGHALSEVEAHSDSYSGSDTLRTAATLVREHADALVAQLYNDYCSKAGGKAGRRSKGPAAAPAPSEE